MGEVSLYQVDAPPEAAELEAPLLLVVSDAMQADREGDTRRGSGEEGECQLRTKEKNRR